MEKETMNTERGSFLEVMSPILDRLKLGKISSNDFISGMNICSEITKIDFRFAYDYFVKWLIETAPQLNSEKYKDVAQSIVRMASYMHRFEISNASLTPLMDVAKNQLTYCKP